MSHRSFKAHFTNLFTTAQIIGLPHGFIRIEDFSERETQDNKEHKDADPISIDRKWRHLTVLDASGARNVPGKRGDRCGSEIEDFSGPGHYSKDATARHSDTCQDA